MYHNLGILNGRRWTNICYKNLHMTAAATIPVVVCTAAPYKVDIFQYLQNFDRQGFGYYNQRTEYSIHDKLIRYLYVCVYVIYIAEDFSIRIFAQPNFFAPWSKHVVAVRYMAIELHRPGPWV